MHALALAIVTASAVFSTFVFCSAIFGTSISSVISAIALFACFVLTLVASEAFAAITLELTVCSSHAFSLVFTLQRAFGRLARDAFVIRRAVASEIRARFG